MKQTYSRAVAGASITCGIPTTGYDEHMLPRSVAVVGNATMMLAMFFGCGGRTADRVEDATVGDAGASDTSDPRVCSQPFPCLLPDPRPDGGPDDPDPCLSRGVGWSEYGCLRVPPSSTGCWYSTPNCPNCVGWCCPPRVEEGPMTNTPAALPDAGKEPAAPVGCVRVPDEDQTCVAQGKPRFAFHCDGTFFSPGCVGSPYPPKGACAAGSMWSDQCCDGR